MTALALEHVDMTFASADGAAPTVAVDDATFSVGDGEVLALLGPSGCGKTTTLRLIAGLLTPSSGDIVLDGASMVSVPPERRGAGLVAQQHTLFPYRTVGENVAYGLTVRRVAKAERAERVAEALESVHLGGYEKRWPSELSGGQQQRVALARALVIRPRLLLLDEPLSSLDQELRGELRATIKDVQRDAAITTVLVTHEQDEAWALADQVAVMIDGRIRQIGTPADLASNPADDAVARYFGVSS